MPNVIVETSFFGNFKQAEDPKVLIIPVPYEYTTSFVKGTKNGPQAILNASIHLENFDDELWLDTSCIGINTSNFVMCEFANNKSSQPFNEVEQIVRNTVIGGCLPIVIGGEHSLSYGSVKAIYDLYPDVSVLHFGARSNLKATHQNNKYSYACTIRRISEEMPDLKIVHVGTRTISQEEAEWLEGSSPNGEMYFSKDKNRWNLADILSNLTKNVYLSFDFSVLDSSIMPSVSTPEPGGLSYEQTTDIIKNVCAFKDIVGMDFVELAPVDGSQAPNFLAAKLIYKGIGYTFARSLGIFEESSEMPEREKEPEALASDL